METIDLPIAPEWQSPDLGLQHMQDQSRSALILQKSSPGPISTPSATFLFVDLLQVLAAIREDKTELSSITNQKKVHVFQTDELLGNSINLLRPHDRRDWFEAELDRAGATIALIGIAERTHTAFIVTRHETDADEKREKPILCRCSKFETHRFRRRDVEPGQDCDFCDGKIDCN